MIDIDKYEGHTKHGEDWKYYWTQGNGGDNWTMLNIKHQDALLLRDAPLLFEEVKRLREELAEALDELDIYKKYEICHPDGTHCCDECLERNGFEVMKND